jgi:hypothetical protein
MSKTWLVPVVTTVALTVLAAACTSGSPHGAAPATHPALPTRTVTPSTEPGRDGLAVPSTYQQACAIESADCLPGAAGAIPAALKRPPHFPALRPGQRCPATSGHTVSTGQFGGIALGDGPVRVLIANTGDLRHGTANLFRHTSAPPWLGLKTLWYSMPAYQGPFVIRAKHLNGPGPVALGEGPVVAPLVVPPGPTLNSGEGYREAPGGLWVKAPGCYAWQVDSLTFSEIIVVHAVLG